MRLHIDADVICYRAGFAAEHTYWDLVWTVDGTELMREFESRKDLDAFMEQEGLSHLNVLISSRRVAEPVEHALFNARSIIRTVGERMEADDLVLYLSGPTNFRLGRATLMPYKGNRDEAHKPVHAADIKAMMRREYNVVTSVDQEADDDIATAHYAMWLRDPMSSVICTIDKDLDMVPGLHYNFVKDERYYMEPEECTRKFYEQLIKGDPTDNIPGIKGMGPAKAAKALAECKDEWAMYTTVRDLYRRAFGDAEADEVLLENAHLLWMRLEPNQWWATPRDPNAST